MLANTSVKPSRVELLSKKNHLYVVFKSSLDIAKVMQMPTKRDDQAKDSQNVGEKMRNLTIPTSGHSAEEGR